MKQLVQMKRPHNFSILWVFVPVQLKDLKRQLHQMQKREARLQQQLSEMVSVQGERICSLQYHPSLVKYTLKFSVYMTYHIPCICEEISKCIELLRSNTKSDKWQGVMVTILFI